VVAGTTLIASAPPATAAPQVSVELTAITITGEGPEAEVALTGRVSNPTGSVVYGIRMAMWRSRYPVESLAGLRDQTAITAPRGLILPRGYVKITEQDEAFAPGASADFTLRASLADLGFDQTGKAYPIGAWALGTSDGSTAFDSVGEARTVLTLPGDPIPVTRLVVLTATPTKLATGLFRNEDLRAELTGRLDALLTAAAEPGASWLIDPALYDEVSDLANGYQVQDGDTLHAGTGQAIATAWLQRFRALDQAAGARTLFGNPDLNGAAAAGDEEVLARARTATEQVTALAGLPLIAIPTAGVSTQAVGSYLGPQTPLLATNVVTPGAHQSAASGQVILAASQPHAAQDFAGRQLALAESVLAGPAGELRLLREPADVAADHAATAPWQRPLRLDALLAAPTSGIAELDTEITPETFSRWQFEAVADLEQAVASYRQLSPDSTIPDEAAGLLTRAVSQAWIGQGKAHAALIEAIDDLIGPQALEQAVHLDASPRFVMSARTSQFPVTVTNNLSEPIRVKVLVETDNPQRLRIPDSDVTTVPAGQSQTITIRPEATANGVAIAQAWVATESGRRLQVEPNAQITIEMTELGFVGWVIVIASGAVVLGATALRIWQVRRKSKRSDQPAESADEPTVVIPGAGDD